MPVLEHPLNRMNPIERNFKARLFSEQVFKYGFPCVYVQKQDFDQNITLGEFNSDIFNKAYDIVCLVRGISEFGNQSSGTKFGFEELDQSTLFIDDIQLKELGLELKVHDIIYFPQLNNKIFQINFVENESERVKYHYGVGFSWQMDIQKYSLNLSDRFNSGNEDIDNINNLSLNTHKNNNKLEVKNDLEQIYTHSGNPLLD